MIELAPETEALAERIAVAQRLSVEAALRQALEAAARQMGVAIETPRPRRDTSAEAVAARVARFDAFAAKIAAAPVNDARSVREIVDDLNAL